MTYYDIYHCDGCPVSKYCGTMVSCSRLCNSYGQNNNAHVLTISKENKYER